MKPTSISRGDIFWVDFDPAKATETKKTRPALVCSNDIMNHNSSWIIVAPVTSNLNRVYSFEYEINGHSGIKGKIMLDQLRSIDKSRLKGKVDHLSHDEMKEVDLIIKFILGLQ